MLYRSFAGNSDPDRGITNDLESYLAAGKVRLGEGEILLSLDLWRRRRLLGMF